MEIYALRDFKKCEYCEDGDLWDMLDLHDKTYIQCPKCKGDGYKIPFKNYEIKKVSEIANSNYRFSGSNLVSRGFKPDDKVVITNA